jgi:hypothetical protein
MPVGSQEAQGGDRNTAGGLRLARDRPITCPLATQSPQDDEHRHGEHDGGGVEGELVGHDASAFSRSAMTLTLRPLDQSGE